MAAKIIISWPIGDILSLTRSLRLCALGVALCSTLLVGSRFAGVLGSPAFFYTMATASVLYFLMHWEFRRAASYPSYVVAFCLLLAAVWRIPFLLSPPGPKDDVLRYVWDGRLQQMGYDPYTVIPSDPAFRQLHTTETREINNPDVPTPYPAGAQLFFRLVTNFCESAYAFKFAFALCEIAIVCVLLSDWRNCLGQHQVLAYAWNPMLVTCVSYNGHIDILGAFCIVTSFVALRRQRLALAAIALAFAIGVKFLPIVLVPLYWRRLQWRHWVLSAVVILLLYSPFIRKGTLPIGSMRTVIERFRFNDPVFSVVERIIHPGGAVVVAIAAGLGVAAFLGWKHIELIAVDWAWPLAASLVFSPIVYPWYLVWLTPFLGRDNSLPLTTWTVSILSVFAIWFLHPGGHPWLVSKAILVCEFGPVAATVLYSLFNHRKRSVTSDHC